MAVQLTDIQRKELRELLEEEGFLGRVLDELLSNASTQYNSTLEDHRYYQGMLHAVFELKRILTQLSLDPASVQDELDTDPALKGRAGQNLTGAY